MDYKIIREADRQVLVLLHSNYKREIGEDAPTKEDIKNLFSAMDNKSIVFYGCYDGETLIACCSITRGFSTFNYSASGVGSLTVGCADCDKKMYRAIGFSIPLGNLLAYEV